MSATISPLPPAIGRYLGGYVARRRRVRLAVAAVVACAIVLAWTLAVGGIDRAFALPAWARGALLAGEVAAVLAVAARPLRDALGRSVDWVEASRQVERRNAALGERLVTVTSQLLTPPAYRGSAQMLDALVAQLCGEIGEASGRRLVGWRGLYSPALALFCLVVATAGLWNLSWLNLPQLIDRQVRPFGGTPPVTTTQIDVTPAGASVRDHEALVIRAAVRRLGDGRSPTVHLRGDSGEWQELPMAAGAGGDPGYSYTIPSVEQDQRFYVTAGDARSPTYPIRVLRRPAMAEVRIRYSYPAYTGRSSLNVRNTDGLIEAPQQTEAVVSVVATEPLASAVMIVDGKRSEMAATADHRVRQAHLVVTKDGPWELEMTSERGVVGRGPRGMQIRAVADRPPLVRLVQPVTDLRVGQRDIVPLSYQALDDYGVAQLVAKAQVNANPPVEIALHPHGGDPRRLDGSFDLDLATLDVKVGDVVSVTIVGTDRAGHDGTSDIRHMLISPRSIDLATHQRLAELSQAVEYAADWADQLAKARQAVDEARRVDGANHPEQLSAAIAKASRILSAAQEPGAMLRQSLIRATVYSGSPKMSDAIASMVDAVVVQLDNLDRVDETISSRRAVEDATSGRMSRTANNARELAATVKRLADGDQAAAVSADRASLATPPTTVPTDQAARDRRRQMFERARQDLAAALAGMGIKPDARDIDQQLQQRIETAARLVEAAKPIDFAAAAPRWAAGIRNKEFQPPRFDERLAVASQVEAVRPDSAMATARDLQWASRAATVLATPPPDAAAADDAKAKSVDQALREFPGVMAALRAEHEVNRRALRAVSPAEARRIHESAAAIHAAAAEARKRLLAWAADGKAPASELAAKAREQDELALAAGVATESRDFDAAAELDRRLAMSLGRPELADLSAAPRAIDRLSTSQEKVADQTAAASDDTQTAGIAGVQQQVADAIAQARQAVPGAEPVNGDDGGALRQKTTEAISQAQEKLASLPMQLSSALESATGVADVRARLAGALAEAAKAAPDEREAAQRVVGMIQLELDDAQKGFEAAAKPFRPNLADDLVETLRPYAPDTSDAVAAADESLRASLVEIRSALAQSAETGDREAVEQSAQHVRDAIAQVQEALRDAQAKVIERDPLVSARWFARAAADALASAPPNRRSAAAHQKKTLEALGKASLDANRRSKNARLSQAPGFSPFYLPPLGGAWGDDAERPTGERLLQTIPGLREWGRLRERIGDSLDAPVRESEPAGYSDALRLYFEVLGREDAKPRGDDKRP